MTASICCAIYRAAGDRRAQPSHFLPKRMKRDGVHTPRTLADKFHAVLAAAAPAEGDKHRKSRKK